MSNQKPASPAKPGGTKNPEQEAEHPAPMPKTQQGQTGAAPHNDLEGQQGGTQGGGREQI